MLLLIFLAYKLQHCGVRRKYLIPSTLYSPYSISSRCSICAADALMAHMPVYSFIHAFLYDAYRQQ